MSPVAVSPNLRIPVRHAAIVGLAVWLLQLGAGALGALPSLDDVHVLPSIEGHTWPMLPRTK